MPPAVWGMMGSRWQLYFRKARTWTWMVFTQKEKTGILRRRTNGSYISKRTPHNTILLIPIFFTIGFCLIFSNFLPPYHISFVNITISTHKCIYWFTQRFFPTSPIGLPSGRSPSGCPNSHLFFAVFPWVFIFGRYICNSHRRY